MCVRRIAPSLVVVRATDLAVATVEPLSSLRQRTYLTLHWFQYHLVIVVSVVVVGAAAAAPAVAAAAAAAPRCCCRPLLLLLLVLLLLLLLLLQRQLLHLPRRACTVGQSASQPVSKTQRALNGKGTVERSVVKTCKPIYTVMRLTVT